MRIPHSEQPIKEITHENLSILIGLIGAGVCIIMVEGVALHAPVTPEMLITLRARGGVDASRDPLLTPPVVENGRIIPQAPKANNATIDSAQFALKQAFNISVSMEGAPGIVESMEAGEERFAYAALANERLLDALERLVQASGGRVRWRLLGGRIVLTAMPAPPSDVVPIGDRQVDVDIDAENFGDAMLQLEIAYNQQHLDVPFAFRTNNYQLAHAKAWNGGNFRVQGKETLRNIILSFMNQSDPTQGEYILCSKHVAVDRRYARKYYYENELYYFGISLFGLHEDFVRAEEKRYRSGVATEPGDEERFREQDRWAVSQFPDMTKRLMGYFDRIYPEWAAREDEAARVNTESAAQ